MDNLFEYWDKERATQKIKELRKLIDPKEVKFRMQKTTLKLLSGEKRTLYIIWGIRQQSESFAEEVKRRGFPIK